MITIGTPLWVMLGIYKVYVKCCRRQQPVVEPLQQEDDVKDGDLMAEEGKDPIAKYALAPTWSADSKTTDII